MKAFEASRSVGVAGMASFVKPCGLHLAQGLQPRLPRAPVAVQHEPRAAVPGQRVPAGMRGGPLRSARAGQHEP